MKYPYTSDEPEFMENIAYTKYNKWCLISNLDVLLSNIVKFNMFKTQNVMNNRSWWIVNAKNHCVYW